MLEDAQSGCHQLFFDWLQVFKEIVDCFQGNRTHHFNYVFHNVITTNTLCSAVNFLLFIF